VGVYRVNGTVSGSLNIIDINFSYKNQDVDEARIDFSADYNAADWTHGMAVAIALDSTTVFRGYVYRNQSSGSGLRESKQVIVRNIWWFWANQNYMDNHQYVISVSSATSYLGTQWIPKIVINGQTASQLLTTCAGWLPTLAVAGTIDVPNFQVPHTTMENVTLVDVIRYVMRWMPNAFTWFNYSVNPPSFNVRTPYSATPAIYAPPGYTVSDLTVTPRHDIKLGGVYIMYDVSVSVNDAKTGLKKDLKYRAGNQAWPLAAAAGSTNILTKTHDLGTRHTMSVAQVNIGSQKIGNFLKTGSPPSFASGAAALFIDYWRRQGWTVAANMAITSTSFEFSRYLSELGGTALLVTEQAWLIDELPREMYYTPENTNGYVVAEVNVTQVINGSTLRGKINVARKASGVINPLTSGTQMCFSPPLPTIPVGVAFGIYNGRNATIYEGSLTLVDEEFPVAILGKNVINTAGHLLTGIQQLEVNAFAGKVTVQFGPGEQLGAQDFISLLRPIKPA